MSEDKLSIDMVLSRSKIRKVIERDKCLKERKGRRILRPRLSRALALPCAFHPSHPCLPPFFLPPSLPSQVQALQSAVHLFDRIATLPYQGRISEIELRLYLAGQGASSTNVTKILKLLRTLLRTDRFDFVTFWDFVTG
jgi:hypothetical protein